MALVWMDSFDHYASADIGEKYPGASAAAVIQAGSGRRSSACLRFATGAVSSVATPILTPASATVVVGLAYKSDYLSVSPMLTIRSGGTAQVSLGFNSGLAQAYRGTATLLGAASTGTITTGAFYFLEFKAVIHPSAGAVVVKINGTVVINLSGVNTAGTGAASWDQVVLPFAFGGVESDYDDFYILDGSGAAPLNDLVGDARVDARYPTAEGATSAWTPLSGTDNALMVDETPPDDDTTYCSTATIGATDTHVVQDAPVAGAVLLGVQVVLSHKKSASGTCAVAPVVRHSGTDYPGTAANPGTSYGFACTPYGLNPGTSAAWTEAGFNAAEFGYRRTA
jgi:hypothetical protein